MSDLKRENTDVLTFEELRTNPAAQAWVKKMNELFFPNAACQRSTTQYSGNSGKQTAQPDTPCSR